MAYTPRNPNGQATMANSEPVVIASNQSAIPVTQSGTWDEIGINDSGNSITVDNGGTFVTQIDGAALTSLQLADDVVVVLGTDTYTETTSKGTVIAAVRRDADTTLVGTTNEFTPLQVDANGRLKVEVFSGETLPVSVSGVSTLAEQQTQTTALQLIDDIVYTDDTSTHATGTSKGALIMAAATPTDTSVNANDIGAVAMTTDRRLLVDASGVAVPVTDNASSLSVDWNGTQPVTGSGTATGALRVELPTNGTGVIATVSTVSALGTGTTGPMKAEDVAHNTGDMGIPAWAVSNEANTARAADGDYLPIASDTEGNIRIVGNRDSDAIDAGEPVKIGFQARQTNPTAVADADRVNAMSDDVGRQTVVINQVRDLVSDQATTISASVAETTIGTQVASTFLDIVALMVANTSASTATRIDFRDTTGGSVRFSMQIPGNTTMGIVPVVPIKQTTVNTNWTAQCSVSTTDIRIFVQFAKNV